jgi:hypothetical protein
MPQDAVFTVVTAVVLIYSFLPLNLRWPYLLATPFNCRSSHRSVSNSVFRSLRRWPMFWLAKTNTKDSRWNDQIALATFG